VVIQTMTLAGKVIQRNDYEVPPRIQSLLFWKDVLAGKIAEYAWVGPLLKANGYEWGKDYSDYLSAQEKIYGTDYCAFCDDAGTRTDDFGYYYCLCWLLANKNELKESCYLWGSDWSPQLLSELELANSSIEDSNRLKATIDRTKAWIEKPDKWLVYSGPTGVGKTHMLNAIMAAWSPYAIYVVASDFEDRLRRYLNEEGNQIQRYLDTLMHHPILVFDDIGMEYATSWITAKLDALIEYRARKNHWWDALTVCATNIRRNKIRTKFVRDDVSRIGSRLTDAEIVDWLVLTGMDYRNKVR
jgi:DNA replication protein DnaC